MVIVSPAGRRERGLGMRAGRVLEGDLRAVDAEADDQSADGPGRDEPVDRVGGRVERLGLRGGFLRPGEAGDPQERDACGEKTSRGHGAVLQ
jgi:hypothetical protein